MTTTNATKGGTSRTGHNGDRGQIVHIIPGAPLYGYWGTPALCGAIPGRKSYGWVDTGNQATCPKCEKIFKKNIK